MGMYFIHQGVTHKIVYIVYHDGIPHHVTTICEKYKSPHQWDFDLHHQWKELMYYESGFGGSSKTISGSHYVDGTTGVTYWMDKSMRISKRHPQINCTRIESPKEISNPYEDKTTNPFEAGQEVGEIRFCDECNGYYNEEHCPNHVEWNADKGDFIYIASGEIAE